MHIAVIKARHVLDEEWKDAWTQTSFTRSGPANRMVQNAIKHKKQLVEQLAGGLDGGAVQSTKWMNGAVRVLVALYFLGQAVGVMTTNWLVVYCL